MITAGLDVGGAHLKVALADQGRIVAAQQFVCPLWQGIDKLDAAFAAAAPLLARAGRFAVTMTGELSDLFPDRATGVGILTARIAGHVGGEAQVWMGRLGFAPLLEAGEHAGDVGSTNFLATAVLVGKLRRDALIVDFGSTTADVIAVRGGSPAVRGFTDAARQASGELVYTGLTRTAVMAVASRVPFQGQWTTLAREYLATMADVRRILGDLPEGADLHATADGKGKSAEESVQRFARLIGRDAHEGTADEWRAAAVSIAETQLRSIDDGVLQVLSATALPGDAPVVAAGIGAGVVHQLAARRGRACIAFGDLAAADESCRDAATTLAPACAVALLAP